VYVHAKKLEFVVAAFAVVVAAFVAERLAKVDAVALATSVVEMRNWEDRKVMPLRYPDMIVAEVGASAVTAAVILTTMMAMLTAAFSAMVSVMTKAKAAPDLIADIVNSVEFDAYCSNCRCCLVLEIVHICDADMVAATTTITKMMTVSAYMFGFAVVKKVTMIASALEDKDETLVESAIAASVATMKPFPPSLLSLAYMLAAVVAAKTKNMTMMVVMPTMPMLRESASE